MLGTLYVASCLLLCIVSGKDVEHAVGGVPQQTPKGALAQKGNTTSGLAASKTSSGALETIDNIISKGTEVRKAAKSFTEQPLKLFCNISGPCKECLPMPEGGGSSGKADVSETHKCRHFSHVQQLDCEVDWATADHPADVKVEPLPEQGITSRQRHTRVAHHQGCVIGGGVRSVFWFEFGMLAVLCISLPIVIWRKHVAQTGH